MLNFGKLSNLVAKTTNLTLVASGLVELADPHGWITKMEQFWNFANFDITRPYAMFLEFQHPNPKTIIKEMFCFYQCVFVVKTNIGMFS